MNYGPQIKWWDADKFLRHPFIERVIFYGDNVQIKDLYPAPHQKTFEEAMQAAAEKVRAERD